MLTHANPIRMRPAVSLLIAVTIALLPACAPRLHSPESIRQADTPPRKTYFPAYSSDFYFNLITAQMCIDSGDWKRARAFYHEALKLAPGSPYILLQLSHLAVILGEPDKAEEYCRSVLETDPYFIDARIFMARLLSSQNKIDAAISQYRLLLDEQPDDEETLLTLATLYAGQEQTGKALDVIHELLAVNPRSAPAFFRLGIIYADTGNAKAAQRAYMRAIELNPDFLQPRISLGSMQEEAGDLTQAIETYRDAADRAPANRLLRSKLAYLYAKTGDLDAALKNYRFLLETAAAFDDAIALRIGLIHFQQENFSDAEAMFQTIIEHDPSDQRALFYLGYTFEKTGKPEEAARAFSSITPESDLFPQSRIELALMHTRSGETDESLQILQGAIAIRPEDTSLYHALAVVHAERQDFPAAIAAVTHALERDSGNEQLLYYLGHLYEKAGMFDKSIAAMRAVLAINGNNADALNFIGYVYAERGIRLREARTLIKKALDAKPDDGYILDSLGWVYFRMGRYRKALKHLERAHRLVPDDATIAEHLGDAMRRLDRIDGALELYRRARDIDPDRQGIEQKINDLERKQP